HLSRQTLGCERFEVILVDDRSQDGAVTSCEAPGELAVVRIKSEGRGSYAARNTGIDVAAAPALAFTDADCRPAPDWLERGLAALEGAPRVAGRVELVADDGEGFAARLDRSRFLRQERYAHEDFGATANLFLRRAVLDEVGRFEDRLVSG